MRKRAAELDADIAHALSKRRTKLRPVETPRIPTESRRSLNTFWRAHPDLRQGCVDKYGFDPIDEEAAYWRFGLAEPDHANVLRAVRQNKNVFSLPLVRRWARQELQDA